MNRRDRRRGLTLVEVLVSMVLLALLTTLAFDGLRFGARSWDRVRTHTERDLKVAQVHMFLRDRIGAVVPASNASDQQPLPALARSLLQGTEKSMAFRASWSPRFATGGRFVFTLWHDVERRKIMLRWTPEVSARASAMTGERTLLDDVDDATFSYFGGRADNGPATWREGWTGADGLPRLVRIDMGAGIPSLQIALRFHG